MSSAPIRGGGRLQRQRFRSLFGFLVKPQHAARAKDPNSPYVAAAEAKRARRRERNLREGR